MKTVIQHFLILSSLFFATHAYAEVEGSDLIDSANIEFLAEMFYIKPEVLSDFVQSYDFKCPKTLTQQELVGILSLEDDETELSVMQESEKLGWRETYLEARSKIECLHEGIVSSPF